MFGSWELFGVDLDHSLAWDYKTKTKTNFPPPVILEERGRAGETMRFGLHREHRSYEGTPGQVARRESRRQVGVAGWHTLHP